MIYVSLDIETTGIDSDNCMILEFGAVIDDLKNPQSLRDLPKFRACFTTPNGLYTGEPYALSMHAELFREIAEHEKNPTPGTVYCDISDLMWNFRNFLQVIGLAKESSYGGPPTRTTLNAAGKNVAMFDLPFLKKKIDQWAGVSFRHRILDVGPLYANATDDYVPDMKTCMERADIEGEVDHTSLGDAMTVVKLIRKKFGIAF